MLFWGGGGSGVCGPGVILAGCWHLGEDCTSSDHLSVLLSGCCLLAGSAVPTTAEAHYPVLAPFLKASPPPS